MPVPPDLQDEVCIIENPAVRPGFVAEYQSALGARGYRHRMLPEDARSSDCLITSTYIGRWSWDMALYMSYAERRTVADESLRSSSTPSPRFRSWWQNFSQLVEAARTKKRGIEVRQALATTPRGSRARRTVGGGPTLAGQGSHRVLRGGVGHGGSCSRAAHQMAGPRRKRPTRLPAGPAEE
jgi:hypothetical protein